MKNTTSLFCRHRRAVLCLLALFATPAVLAETITIGKGSGIVWEGLPFNVTLSGPMKNRGAGVGKGLLAISTAYSLCQSASTLTTINNYKALQITPGVGLIPRASGTATFTRAFSSKVSTLTGTIGLPTTEGASEDNKTYYNASYSWCLNLVASANPSYYDSQAERTAQLSGTWVLVADGTQKNTQITLPTMYAASYAHHTGNSLIQSILPKEITLRVSTLECTVNTPTSIAFGNVPNYTQAGAEMGTLSYPLITTCGQKSDFIDANINLQFRQLSGLYNNDPAHLALKEGGGYITGEIDNGVTGSGSCTATTGLLFDDTELKVGNITEAQTSATFTHQVTWRLCSGGQDLPLGDVSAAAEMLVTFN